MFARADGLSQSSAIIIALMLLSAPCGTGRCPAAQAEHPPARHCGSAGDPDAAAANLLRCCAEVRGTSGVQSAQGVAEHDATDGGVRLRPITATDACAAPIGRVDTPTAALYLRNRSLLI